MINLKKYIPIGLAIIIVLLILAGYFFVYPKYQEYLEKKEELDTKDINIANKEKYLPKLEAVTKRLSEYIDQVSIVESALPVDPSIAALSNYFQKILSQNGLILKNINVSQLFTDSTTESPKGVKDMKFSVSANGSYASFKNLLLDIYLNARIIEVDSFSFSSEDNLSDYSLNLKTQSYDD